VNSSSTGSRPGQRAHRTLLALVLATASALALAAPVFADTVNITGRSSGQTSTATVVCEFNAQTNTFTFTATNTSAITFPGSTSTITAFGFDLPPGGNANASGLNGFTGMQAPSLSSNFVFSDADVGGVPGLSTLVLDFGFLTGVSGTFAGGSVNDGLLPGESASFTVSGAAFSGFTEAQICNAVVLQFMNVPSIGTDVGATNAPSWVTAGPDARIKRSGGPLKGDDVVNTTGAGQYVALTPPGGSFRRVYITIQNQGNGPDSFHLSTTGTTPAGYVLRYFKSRTNDELTAAIEAGTFVTPEIQPGELFRIRVRVETTFAAQVGSELLRLYTFTSDADSGAQDAVKLTVTRT